MIPRLQAPEDYIATPCATSLYQAIQKALARKRGFLAVTGQPGTGKSYSLSWIFSKLRHSGLGQVAILHFSYSAVRPPCERLEEALFLARIESTLSRTNSENLQRQLCFSFSDFCVQQRTTQLLLAIDGAEHLSVDPIPELEGLSVLLRKFGIDLVVLLVGSSLVFDERDCSRRAFRGTHFQYFGLRSVADVSSWLDTYRTLANSGQQTYSPSLNYLTSKELVVGHLAESLWHEFQSYQSALGIESWGLDVFTMALNWISYAMVPHQLTINDQIVEQALLASGLLGLTGCD